MKHIESFITEKLRINKNIKSKKLSFNHIDKDQIEPFWGYNWILNNDYFDNAKILLQYALENCGLTNKEEEFIEKFKKDIEECKQRKSYFQKTEILNGKRNNGYYQRPKCLYDICKYIIDNEDFDNNLLKNLNKDDIEGLIFDVNNITNNDIEKLDWSY